MISQEFLLEASKRPTYAAMWHRRLISRYGQFLKNPTKLVTVAYKTTKSTLTPFLRSFFLIFLSLFFYYQCCSILYRLYNKCSNLGRVKSKPLLILDDELHPSIIALNYSSYVLGYVWLFISVRSLHCETLTPPLKLIIFIWGVIEFIFLRLKSSRILNNCTFFGCWP